MYTVFRKFGTKFVAPTATGEIPVNNAAGTNWGFLGLYFAYGGKETEISSPILLGSGARGGGAHFYAFC